MTTLAPSSRGPGRPRKFPTDPIVIETPKPTTAIPLTDRHCLSVKDASAYIGISITGIWAALGKGELAAKRYGRKPLILRSSLEAYVASLPDYSS
jgi:excisionase family DNA binding protein